MKKLLALLAAVSLVVLSLSLVSCDEEEERVALDSDDLEVDVDITQEDLDELYSNIFGSDFEDLFGSGSFEFPDEEV